MNLFLVENNNRDDNLGDQLISRELARFLSNFGKVRILGQPKAYHCAKAACTRLIYNKLWRFVTSLLGLRIFQVFPAGGWGKPKSESPALTRSGWRRLLQSRIHFRKIVLGANIYIDPAFTGLDDFKLLGVRDQRSLDSLRQRPHLNATFFPDLAVLDESIPQANITRHLHTAVSFRNATPEGVAFDPQGLAAFFQAFALAAPQCAHFNFFHQVAEDATFAKQLSLLTAGATLHTPKLELQSYQAFYQQQAFCISNRLHCLLLAAANGCIPIALTSPKHLKLADCLSAMGWERFLFFTDAPATWPDKLHALASNLPAQRDFIATSRSDLRTKAFATFEHFLKASAS